MCYGVAITEESAVCFASLSNDRSQEYESDVNVDYSVIIHYIIRFMMCNDYEYCCSCFMNVIEHMVASRNADVHFSLQKQITGAGATYRYYTLH